MDICCKNIRNICYNLRLNKTPFETFTKIKPNLSNMHIFCTKIFVNVENKSKLRNFFGYDEESPSLH